MEPAVKPTRSCIEISGVAVIGRGSTAGVFLVGFGFGLAFLGAALATLVLAGASGTSALTVFFATKAADSIGIVLTTSEVTAFLVVFLVVVDFSVLAFATGVSVTVIVFFILGLRWLRKKIWKAVVGQVRMAKHFYLSVCLSVCLSEIRFHGFYCLQNGRV